MSRLIRTLRSVVRLGLSWGVLWAVSGVTIGMVIGVIDPPSIDPGESPIQAGAIMGLVGLASGVIFGGLLSFAEDRRTIREIPLVRAVIWGVLASATLPLLTPMNDALLLTTCPLGVVSALVSVALARRRRRRWRSLF